MRAALEGAKTALAKTPDMLPVLKEVGVVASGGQGFVFIYEGFLSALTFLAKNQDLDHFLVKNCREHLYHYIWFSLILITI